MYKKSSKKITRLYSMKILLVAATIFEILPCLQFLKVNIKNLDNKSINFFFTENNDFEYKNLQISVLITGAGVGLSAFNIGTILATHPFNCAIQAGVAGAFDTHLQLGEVVHITTDIFADCLAENGNEWIPIAQMPFFNPNEYPFQNGFLSNNNIPQNIYFKDIKAVKGVTTNRITGSPNTYHNLLHYFNTPQVETMETASFFYACLHHQVPFCAIRAISNYVLPQRQPQNWQMKLAINNLNNFLINIFKSF